MYQFLISNAVALVLQCNHNLFLFFDLFAKFLLSSCHELFWQLSVFAETLYEMLQYQMGCRLLTFLQVGFLFSVILWIFYTNLYFFPPCFWQTRPTWIYKLVYIVQKLRIKFVTKRNKRKRQKDLSAKKSELVSPVKRMKTDMPTVEVKVIKTESKDESVKPETKDKSPSNLVESIKSETNNESQTDVGIIRVTEEGNFSINEAIKVKPDDEADEDEDRSIEGCQHHTHFFINNL